MAPLMCLNGDEIVEAVLLEPMDNETGTSPTPEEEAALLGGGIGAVGGSRGYCISS